jgi:redox-sensitive bicupin YhaK (pirin superfamily)
MEPTFEHYRPEPLTGPGWTLRVFLGSLAGATSPVTTHTPLLGAEILLEAGARLTLDTDPSFEHGLLVDAGAPLVDGRPVAKDHLAYLPVGRMSLTLEAGVEPLRVLLIGGEPLGEKIVMWWNFVGRSHEEIVGFRAQWQAEIGAEAPPSVHPESGGDNGGPRFGTFPQGEPAPLPAPALPNARLRPRD